MDLTPEQVDRLMLALDKLDAYLENVDTTRKPRTRTKVVYRDPPDPKAVDLAALADSINRRLTLLEAGRAVQDDGLPTMRWIQPTGESIAAMRAALGAFEIWAEAVIPALDGEMGDFGRDRIAQSQKARGYRATPPLPEPAPASESGQPPEGASDE